MFNDFVYNLFTRNLDELELFDPFKDPYEQRGLQGMLMEENDSMGTVVRDNAKSMGEKTGMKSFLLSE